MTEAIIVALITASATVICQLILANKQRKDNETRQAVRDREIEDRLAQIEHKLDVHNGYAEKLGDIQTDIAVIKNDIKTLYKETKP